MARLVSQILILTLIPGAAAAQAGGTATSDPWHSNEKIHSPRSFDIPDQPVDPRSDTRFGSRIIAGTQLTANGMVGFGLFGQKSEKGPLSAVTARDLALPKSRKAAVGFSLRF